LQAFPSTFLSVEFEPRRVKTKVAGRVPGHAEDIV